MNLFKRFNVDIGVTFMFLCTRKDYRSKGLASRTFQAAILFCKELGLSPVCIKGVGSTLHSQRIYEKCGFETIHVLRHDEYIIDGEVIFKNTEDVESTKCYLKQL
jgi:GNAT superfamily N-acetyltransferase